MALVNDGSPGDHFVFLVLSFSLLKIDSKQNSREDVFTCVCKNSASVSDFTRTFNAKIPNTHRPLRGEVDGQGGPG